MWHPNVYEVWCFTFREGIVKLIWDTVTPPYCDVIPIKINNKLKNKFINFYFHKIVTKQQSTMQWLVKFEHFEMVKVF